MTLVSVNFTMSTLCCRTLLLLCARQISNSHWQIIPMFLRRIEGDLATERSCWSDDMVYSQMTPRLRAWSEGWTVDSPSSSDTFGTLRSCWQVPRMINSVLSSFNFNRFADVCLSSAGEKVQRGWDCCTTNSQASFQNPRENRIQANRFAERSIGYWFRLLGTSSL